MKKRIISGFLCMALLCAIFSGCTVQKSTVRNAICNAKENYVQSGVIAQSGNTSLVWDAERSALLIKESDKIIWSSMPIEQYTEQKATGAVMKLLESSLVVEYIAGTSGDTVTSINSYLGAYENGRIYSYLIKNGIRLLYCFDDLFFAIPVEYRLKNGYLDVKIVLDQIYECSNRITKISLLPYAGGLANSTENKIFIPDGSGMIMNCDEDRPVRTYSGAVYGEDKVELDKYNFLSTENVKLPVYAFTTSDNTTYCTIIDKNEACADINSSAGDTILGYSYAYTTFNIRGKNTVTIPSAWGGVDVSKQYSDIPSGMDIGERIYFLDSYDESFVNVANCYRNYLIEEKGLKDMDDDEIVYVDIPMALQQRDFLFGLPYQSTKVVTTYERATEIIEDFVDETNISPVVRLKGIQNGGLDVTKIAGGFNTEKKLGNKNDLNSLLQKTSELGVSVFPDFDISRFNTSSSGFNVNKNSACNSTGMKASQYFHSVSTGVSSGNSESYYLLTPKLFVEASDELMGPLEKSGFKNISLSTLGSGYYSDYRYNENNIGAGYAEAIENIFENYNSSQYGVMFDSANQYAAVNANHIVNIPTYTSDYDAQDEWLPFYQMVFKGFVPLSSNSVNLVNNSKMELLRSIQCGVALKFTVCGSDTADYANSNFTELLAGSYENCKSQITNYLSDSCYALNTLKNSKIISFAKIDENIYETNFDNGCSVIVNYSQHDYLYNEDMVEAESFIVLKGE